MGTRLSPKVTPKMKKPHAHDTGWCLEWGPNAR
jgi:hypothetical protein